MDQAFQVAVVFANGRTLHSHYPLNIPGVNQHDQELTANRVYDSYAYRQDVVYAAMFSPFNMTDPSRHYSRGW